MIQLTNDIKNFTNILHIGDIHIRLTQRHQEYAEAFDKLYKAVDNTKDSTLVLIAGDIFHSHGLLAHFGFVFGRDVYMNHPALLHFLSFVSGWIGNGVF